MGGVFLSPKAGLADNTHPFLVGSIVPAWQEEDCAFLLPLDALAQATLFCTRSTAISSLHPQALLLVPARDIGE